MHKKRRIRLFGPTVITSTRPMERLHISAVKTAYIHTNHKEVEEQLMNQVSYASTHIYYSFFKFELGIEKIFIRNFRKERNNYCSTLQQTSIDFLTN